MGKKHTIMIIGIVLVLALIGIFGIARFQKTVDLPYQADQKDGNLEISSLYQFIGPNPDCNDEQGEDVASLTVTNPEGNKYMKEASIVVTMKDKSHYEFKLEHIPAGKTVQVFDQNNATYVPSDESGKENAIKSIKVKTEFSETNGIDENHYTVQVNPNETEVTVTNISDQDEKDVTVRCHTFFDGGYYGGRAYEYKIPELKAGSSMTFDATECYIGTAEAVCIE